ncbi:MAG: DUF4013 domain-containing protein [Coriobacteriaceae bacterium]|nr:DUF4013 domain-containing protein [Coriobacteriaceae bacterium]
MLAQQMGFSTSWKMLRRDKGWIKPLLVLALVSWIPILGQIVLLGYAYEWARLSAWGVDSAPKQGGVDYAKMLKTGAFAFLVSLTMSLPVAAIDILLFGGSSNLIVLFGSMVGHSAASAASLPLAAEGAGGLIVLISMVVNVILLTFVQCAMMRSTIYDGFGAGWRLDRLFEMVSRDAKGFFKLVGINALAAIVQVGVGIVVGLVVAVVFLACFAGSLATLGVGMSFASDPESVILSALFSAGPVLLLLVVLVALAAGFIGNLANVAMTLVAVNATGQWFARFKVETWGISSAPLPEGVPVVSEERPGVAPKSPVQPEAASATAPAGSDPASVPARTVSAHPDKEESTNGPVETPKVSCASEDPAPAALLDTRESESETVFTPSDGGSAKSLDNGVAERDQVAVDSTVAEPTSAPIVLPPISGIEGVNDREE